MRYWKLQFPPLAFSFICLILLVCALDPRNNNNHNHNNNNNRSHLVSLTIECKSTILSQHTQRYIFMQQKHVLIHALFLFFFFFFYFRIFFVPDFYFCLNIPWVCVCKNTIFQFQKRKMITKVLYESCTERIVYSEWENESFFFLII